MRHFLLAALGLLSAISGSWYWQQRQEAQLLAALAPLTQTLEAVNVRARHMATLALKQLEETVAKNRNQPRDLAVFAAATHLHAQASQLLAMLQAQRSVFRHNALNPGAAAQQQVQRQLAAYALTLQQLPTPDSLALPAFHWGQAPVVAMLADLTHLENLVLDSETQAIRQLTRTVGVRSVPSRLVAVATAESAVVAPGDTYRAHLFLLKSLVPQSLHMYCNGQAVPVGTDGTGYVRFRASVHPGPATWTGTIRLHQNGRDTTFTVRVPYRVARR